MTKEEFEQKVNTVNRLRYAYYVLDDPMVSDAYYDRIHRDLEIAVRLNPNWDREDLPTNTVGSSLKSSYSQDIIDFFIMKDDIGFDGESG